MTKQCGAKTRSGAPCKSPAMPNGRCRMHGGATPSGPAHGAFKHGRYSKDLPTRLAARYEQAASDPELLALHQDIALVDARLGDLLSRADTGESGERWRQARDLFRDLHRAMQQGEAETVSDLMGKLSGVLGRGASDYAAWSEISALLEQRRRLVESERKRLVEMQVTMDVRQAMVFVGAVLETVRRHVTDRQQLAAIGVDIQRLLATTGERPRLPSAD